MAMSPAQASRTVVVCAFVEAFFILARSRNSGETRDATVKSLWAIGVITLGLSMAADFVPQVAGPFAILILAALAARQRGEIGQILGVSGAAPATAAPRTTVTPSGGVTSTPTTGREAPGFSPGG